MLRIARSNKKILFTKFISSNRHSRAIGEDVLNEDKSRTFCASANFVPITIAGGESKLL